MRYYGLSRLVLLNSANYDLAEVPLDDSVSIIGPNNAGKTTLINALQFLLISDRRQMDFGAHDDGVTLKYYFPGQSSFILLEAQLESGLAVLGCVGKGASHEYQHFAYMGSLNVEEFRRFDGSIVQEPDLRKHLSKQGKNVHYFPRSNDFFDAIYGRSSKKTPGDLNLSLYKLEAPKLKNVFQKILVRTLRLDKLQAEDVKEFLLQIFIADYGKSIDFQKEWSRAFETLNFARSQYQSCRRIETRILEMEEKYEEQLVLRGKISSLRPEIDTALLQWESYKSGKEKELSDTYVMMERSRKDNKIQDESLIEERTNVASSIKNIEKEKERLEKLESDFIMVPNCEELDRQLEQVSQEVAGVRVILEKTQTGNLSYTEDVYNQKKHELLQRQIERELGDKLLGSQLQSLLSPEEMAILNGLIHEDLFRLDTVKTGEPNKFAQEFRSFLQEQGDNLTLAGLTIPREKVYRQYSRSSNEELDIEIMSIKNELVHIEQEISALRDRVGYENRLIELQDRESHIRQYISDYKELEELRSSIDQRAEKLTYLVERQEQILQQRKSLENEQEVLHRKMTDCEQSIKELTDKHQKIDKLRNNRSDLKEKFLNLHKKKHTPWYQTGSVELDNLDNVLRQQEDDCEELQKIDSFIQARLRDIFYQGFNKFQGLSSEEEQVERILSYTRNLDNEEETLQKDLRAAVTNVASSLLELKRQYEMFQSQLLKFNRLIGKRQLSDLDQFKIGLCEHSSLLDSIKTILSSTDSADMLDQHSLFDTMGAGQDSVGDKELDNAKDQLLKFSKDNGSLKLEHLFGLEFKVAKSGQALQRFDQLDKIGSNGTVLMAKLISGLALLHQMLDRRHQASTICYLDEAASLDDSNQKSLIETAREFGFNLLFASPTPQNSVRYCVPIVKQAGKNFITRKQWQVFEELETAS